MMQLPNDPIVHVTITYALKSGRVEVNSGDATADAVLVVLQKALYAALAGSVKVRP